MNQPNKTFSRIGLYGGTFDPVHFGHINLALALQEAHHLDEVWWCPAWINPHKSDQQINPQPTSFDHRFKMLCLATEDIPSFRVLDIESQRPGPSYTIDTLKLLVQKEKDKKFFLLLGDDSARNFFKWRQAEEILSYAELLVGQRTTNPILNDVEGSPKIQQAIKQGVTPMHCLEISGTEIRARLQKGLYCGHLVPAKVLDTIYQNRLYYSA